MRLFALFAVLLASGFALAAEGLTFAAKPTDPVALVCQQPGFELGDDFTIEAWVKPSENQRSKTSKTIISRMIPKEYGRTRTGFGLWLEGERRIPWMNGKAALGADAGIPAGKWAHLVGVVSVSQGIQKLYVNGTLAASIRREGADRVMPAGAMEHPRFPMRIGAANRTASDRDDGSPFSGIIRRVTCYNRALTDAEIATLAGEESMASLNFAGRVGDWDLARPDPQWRTSSAPGAVPIESPRLLTGRPQGPDLPLCLWYRQPADQWVEALPVGNGRLGAMVFGAPDFERLQLNEISVWSGGPENADRPEAYKALPAIRKAIREERYNDALTLCSASMTSTPESTYDASYQTLGDLNFRITLPDGPVTDYRRWLDVSQAVAGVEFSVGGETHRRECFSSAPDQTLIYKLSSSRKGGVTFTMDLGRCVAAKVAPMGADGLIMTGTSDYHGKPGNLGYEVQTRVLAPGGTVSAAGSLITVTGADEATVVLAAGTTYVLDFTKHYRGADPHAAVTRALAGACAKPFADLRAAHVADYRSFFDRVALTLPGTDAAKLPTDERRKAYATGTDDPGLAALFYQYGRFLMICSSRPDNQLPSNSQGIWGDGMNMPWHSDYKSNINFQMNYWSVGPGNLNDCHVPALNLMRSVVIPGHKTAKAYFNAPGWVLAMMTNIWGHTSPGRSVSWGTFFAGGAWYGQHLWDHFAFTRDRAYLQEVWPVIKESCEFYLAILIEDADGFLVTSPSTSPENRFKTDTGLQSCVNEGVAMECQIIWDLFNNAALASAVLGDDPAFRDRLVKTRDRIRPPRIGKAGQLMEWGKDWDLNAQEPQHRHVSHLFALHPGRQISPLTTPDLAAAAKKSLELRGDGGTGWSMAWKINFWARLHDGNHAALMFNKLLGKGTYDNLFDAHPPFQIDGNFGAVSGINEMLLQSQVVSLDLVPPSIDRYVLHLLPALPDQWASGSIHGIRARGGFTVDLEWKEMKLVSTTIRSLEDSACKVRYGAKVIDLAIPKGGTVEVDAKRFAP